MAELTEKNISNENDGKGLEALKNLQNEQENKDVVQEEIIKKEPVIDNLGRSYATGRRKSSIARVWIKRGKGKISVNGGEPSKHFGRAVLLMIIESPFEVADRKGEFDVVATVKGGGLSGQAGTSAVGSPDIDDISIGLILDELTSNLGILGIQHYANIDSGSNTSYSDVSTGSNDTYSDVATGSNTSYSDAA